MVTYNNEYLHYNLSFKKQYLNVTLNVQWRIFHLSEIFTIEYIYSFLHVMEFDVNDFKQVNFNSTWIPLWLPTSALRIYTRYPYAFGAMNNTEMGVLSAVIMSAITRPSLSGVFSTSEVKHSRQRQEREQRPRDKRI